MPKRIKLYIFLLSLPFVAGLVFVGVFFKIKLDKVGKSFYLQDEDVSNAQNETYSAVPFDLEFYEDAYKFYKKKIDFKNGNVIAGIIPHHLLASDLIAEFYSNLSKFQYDTIILLGPNHFNAGNSDIIISQYNWKTPYGILEADREMAVDFYSSQRGHGCVFESDEAIFQNEHSVNSQVAFIKKTFPNAKFLPIVLKPSVNSEQAKTLAEKIYDFSKNKKILVLASVDFSHYKNNKTAQTHDKESITAIESFDFDKIYGLDIDSPASIYTLMEYSRMQGAGFSLLNNSNSAILSGKYDLEETTSYATGYFLSEAFFKEVDSEREPSTSSRSADAEWDFARDDSKKNNIMMLFFGDLMLDRYVKEKIEKGGVDIVLGGISEAGFFDGYDVISANLEGAITDNGAHYEPTKEFDFAFAPKNVAELKKYNFNFFNIANNHLDDQGARGVIETRKNLDELGFNYSGCANGEVGERSVWVMDLSRGSNAVEEVTVTPKVTVTETRVGMIGISAVWDKIDMEKTREMIKNLKEKTDFVVVNVHWGMEYENDFNKSQQEIARGLIDAGADIIIGHHPHVVQGAELYNGKLIFYSLGNFVFDQYFSKKTQEGLAVEVALEDGEILFKLHPFKSKQSRVELMEGEEREAFLRALSEKSVGDEEFLGGIKNGQILAKFDKE